MAGLSHLGRNHQQRWGIELEGQYACRDTEHQGRRGSGSVISVAMEVGRAREKRGPQSGV